MVNVGINGFGRIGRLTLRLLAEKPVLRSRLKVVAINDPGPGGLAGFAHLLKYDSVHGAFPGKVEVVGSDLLKVEGLGEIKFLALKETPKWKELGVEMVLESSGKFADADKAKVHLEAGAKRVLVSAPSKGADATIVFGVNHEVYDRAKHYIVSGASCTTNCLAPIAWVLHRKFGIIDGIMTTIHAYTNDQVNLDGPHKDPYRARAAALSMIPTTTGAAKAVGEVLPELRGKLHGFAVRVPTPNVSLVDLSVRLAKNPTVEEINQAMKEASEKELKGVLLYNELPLVSIDFNHNPYPSIYNAPLTLKVGEMYKVLAWYDNEWGFTNQFVKLAGYMASREG
jgi:glyceraldehyde 3-phosphate dehydrogenase